MASRSAEGYSEAIPLFDQCLTLLQKWPLFPAGNRERFIDISKKKFRCHLELGKYTDALNTLEYAVRYTSDSADERLQRDYLIRVESSLSLFKKQFKQGVGKPPLFGTSPENVGSSAG